jgi:tRNA-dihydrouridine synthase B
MKTPDFYVGTVPIFGRAILSPMAGFSDLPFRALCRRLGSAMSYTEFISAPQYLNNYPLIENKLEYLPEERPVVYQIFDSRVDNLLEMALRVQERQPDIIDINMGCSTRCVTGRGAGAGLLRTPLKIARIFRKLSASLEIPITGKIRIGWDNESRNHVLIARIIEENGGKLVAVHGRTRQQGYSGSADWDAIAEVKAVVSIPVIGNGDVQTVSDIRKMQEHTGCDAVMVGRAAIGNPWIFSGLEREQVSQDIVKETVQRHLAHSLDFHGDKMGLILFRKHASRYLRPYQGFDQDRQRLLTASSPEEFLQILDEVLQQEAVSQQA